MTVVDVDSLPSATDKARATGLNIEFIAVSVDQIPFGQALVPVVRIACLRDNDDSTKLWVLTAGGQHALSPDPNVVEDAGDGLRLRCFLLRIEGDRVALSVPNRISGAQQHFNVAVSQVIGD